jgi:hypothetical protein
MNDNMDGDLFRIERLLYKLFKLPVRTARREDAAYFTLGGGWTIRLDDDDIEKLTSTLSSEHVFMETLDNMLDRCMSLREVRDSYRRRGEISE